LTDLFIKKSEKCQKNIYSVRRSIWPKQVEETSRIFFHFSTFPLFQQHPTTPPITFSTPNGSNLFRRHGRRGRRLRRCLHGIPAEASEAAFSCTPAEASEAAFSCTRTLTLARTDADSGGV
jgi:hypothetical protein